MGAQPATLQSGLVTASASTDFTAPQTTITSHADNDSVFKGENIVIGGTSSDVGGVVAAVEISVDGGSTWAVATGTSSWNYSWTPSHTGTVIIKVRGTDDSGNMEGSNSSNTITLHIVNPPCPCTIFKQSDAPALTNSLNSVTGTGIELGTKFRSDSSGYITGMRFYKSLLDTGTHVLSLWSAAGTLLGRDTLTPAMEKTSGWQEVVFNTPVPIQANQVYVASYHSPTGYHAETPAYFTDSVSYNMLVGLKNDNAANRNGVYINSGSPAFPVNMINATNYWVDVVFVITNELDTISPAVTSVLPGVLQTDVKY